MRGEANEVDDMQVKNIGMTDKIVFSFFENAYNTINTSEQTDSPKGPKCHIKDHYLSGFHKLIQTKKATLVDKYATDIGLVKKMK